MVQKTKKRRVIRFPKRTILHRHKKKLKIIDTPLSSQDGNKEQTKYFKPNGLWYACGSSWYNFVYKNLVEIKSVHTGDKENEEILEGKIGKNFLNFPMEAIESWRYLHSLELRHNSFVSIRRKWEPSFKEKKILRIKNLKDLIVFDYIFLMKDKEKIKEQFEINGAIVKAVSLMEFMESGFLIYRLIDWEQVMNHYAGIEICPFHLKFKNRFWYYLWDVASGVIWRNQSFFVKETKYIDKIF